MDAHVRTTTRRLLLPLLFSALAASPGAAGDFSERSLVGRYVFSLSDGASSISVESGHGSGLDVIGWFQADGEGGLTGVRTVRRQVAREIAEAGPNLVATATLQSLVERQQFSGTYQVDEDGMATMELTAAPQPGWLWRPWRHQRVEVRAEETWHLALSRGGERARVLARAIGDSQQSPWFTVDFLLRGEAERDVPGPPSFAPTTHALPHGGER